MILERIAHSAKVRVQNAIVERPFEQIKKNALNIQKGSFEFEKALKFKKLSFICEVKKASPSKGVISEHFPFEEIALEYQNAGASAISVLTEPIYFQGSDEYLTKIKSKVNIPVLRKDFTVSEYQIYEAKLIGADAVLLICALLDLETIRRYLKICNELGVSALTEVHDELEVEKALSAGAKIIGVNNRNLKTFEVDIENSIRLRPLVPKEVLFVAESGIKDENDVKRLKAVGVDAVLIGETLMKSDDKRAMLCSLKGV